MQDKFMPIGAKEIIKKNRFSKIVILGLTILSVIMIGVCATFGDADISLTSIYKIIIGKITFNPEMYGDIPEGIVAIIWDIRLPRIICGIFVGAGLSVAGAVFQSLLMNPLADPYTIGISTGAALGASIAIFVTGILAIATIPVLPAAFVGAILTLFVVMKIASRGSGLSSSNLIIAGIIVSSILSAGISFIKYAAGDEVGAIVFWIMGSLASRTWTHVFVAVPVISFCVAICIYYANELNVLCNGDDTATVLGINVKKVRRILLTVASLMTAACVSVAGVIGFVGLVIPHLLRFGVTSNNRNLIPMSALAGGLLLMVADNVTRVLFGGEIPVGVLTTLVGGPFFIYVFLRKSKRGGLFS
ncbi:MAG: iron ABC transporter permease [Anaerovoracaceae bacterium]